MQANSTVTVGSVTFDQTKPFSLIAGPCQLEGRQHAFDMAGALIEMCAKAGIGLVYKSSYDKANRTSIKSTRGIGLDASLEIFSDLRKEYGMPTLTDVHAAEHCAIVAPHVDVLHPALEATSLRVVQEPEPWPTTASTASILTQTFFSCFGLC